MKHVYKPKKTFRRKGRKVNFRGTTFISHFLEHTHIEKTYEISSRDFRSCSILIGKISPTHQQ